MTPEEISYLKSLHFDPPKKWATSKYVLIQNTIPKYAVKPICDITESGKIPVIILYDIPATRKEYINNFTPFRFILTILKPENVLIENPPGRLEYYHKELNRKVRQ